MEQFPKLVDKQSLCRNSISTSYWARTHGVVLPKVDTKGGWWNVFFFPLFFSTFWQNRIRTRQFIEHTDFSLVTVSCL